MMPVWRNKHFVLTAAPDGLSLGESLSNTLFSMDLLKLTADHRIDINLLLPFEFPGQYKRFRLLYYFLDSSLLLNPLGGWPVRLERRILRNNCSANFIQDRWEEAIETLARLHGMGDINNPKVLAEYKEIEEALRFEREEAVSSLRQLMQPKMFRRVIVRLMRTIVLQNLS